MKTAIALFLGLFLALPALGATFVPGPDGVPPIEWPPLVTDTDCTSTQGANVNASLGIQGAFGPLGACLPGDPGQPGDLVGFAFPLLSCQDGFVKTTRVQFNVAEASDRFQLYLWRDQGGLPIDACGLECGVATNPLTIGAAGPTVRSYSWVSQQCPCLTFNTERLHVGVVYVNGTTPADWSVGRNNAPVGAGFGYGNLTGNHGDWADLNGFGYGNRWGVENVIGPSCGTVPVEETTWGTVKSLYD